MTNDFSGGLRGLRPPATFFATLRVAEVSQLYSYPLMGLSKLLPSFPRRKRRGYRKVFHKGPHSHLKLRDLQPFFSYHDAVPLYVSQQTEYDKSSSNESSAWLAGITCRRDRGAGGDRCTGFDHSTVQAANKQRSGSFVRAQKLVAAADGDGVGNFINVGVVVVARFAALVNEDCADNSVAAGDCGRMVCAAEPL